MPTCRPRWRRWSPAAWCACTKAPIDSTPSSISRSSTTSRFAARRPMAAPPGISARIEIENSTDAEVAGNWAHDNVGGILVFNLPGLPVRDGKRANVHHNRVENNNLDSFADPAGIVALVPGGTGMILLASDSNEIH